MKRMTTKVLICVILMWSGVAGATGGIPPNPYAPHNAVTAEPPTPYNLNMIPRWSRVDYLPCPSLVPYSKQVPDLPSLDVPMPGPFWRPVPVP